MNRYNNLNGFRAFCAIGIALMHILANISPTPHLHNITPVIEWFTNFVFLFFIIRICLNLFIISCKSVG